MKCEIFEEKKKVKFYNINIKKSYNLFHFNHGLFEKKKKSENLIFKHNDSFFLPPEYYIIYIENFKKNSINFSLRFGKKNIFSIIY
jgi:hypothetical protein